MKNRIILEIMFICVFGLTGWYLFGVMEQMKSNNPKVENNNTLVFSDGSGIDIQGNIIDSVFEPESYEIKRSVAAFLLRYDSLDADLTFWKEVNSYLTEPDAVRLTAYCENDLCIKAIKNKPDLSYLTVLEYGEAIDMHALIGADSNGEFWFRENRAGKIKWRGENLTPFDIANSIGMGQ